MAATAPDLGAFLGDLGDLELHELVASARLLERAGFTTLWLNERAGRDPFVLAALLLDATDAAMVAIGVASLWMRAPATMWAGASTLAEAHAGRFTLGLGVGHRYFSERRGVDYRRPLDSTSEYLRTMREVTYEGPEAPFALLLGANGPGMLRLARDLADGACPFYGTPRHTSVARDLLGPGAFLAPGQAFTLERDQDAALEAARAHLAHRLELDNYRRHFARQGFATGDLEGRGSAALASAIVASGGEDAVLARAVAHLRAGADHVNLRSVATTPSAVLSELRRVAAVAACP